MTYSIVAHDPQARMLGVAVQSHWFSVGSVVTWGEPGVGVVATQAFVEPAYGPRGISIMAQGTAADVALRSLLEADPGADVRQVAFMDTLGRIGAHTGRKCLRYASHVIGVGCSAQANMMLRETVPKAMVDAFETTAGTLAERMMRALEAAEGEGGDIRGRQSAAMLIVRANASDQPWRDRVLELRVEDHTEPLNELRRLIGLHEAYEHMNRGDAALETENKQAAFREYAAAAALVPDSLEIQFWNGLMLAQNGKLDEGRTILKKVFATDANWLELLHRLPEGGLVGAALAAELTR